MDTFLTIASKRDQRAYADRDIPADLRDRIVDAGRLAGSAQNRQPLRCFVLESRDVLDRVAHTVYVADNVLGARLVIALVAAGRPGFDAGRAAQNMMLAAWNEGVTSCPNGMPDPASPSSTSSRSVTRRSLATRNHARPSNGLSAPSANRGRRS